MQSSQSETLITDTLITEGADAMTTFPSVPLSVFYCSASEDSLLCDALEKQLDPLKRNGWIQTWHDREISAGTEREPEITRRLHAAHLILLLVSPDLLTSESCYQQMEMALERHLANEAVVIPIIVRPVDWQSTSMRSLQVLPRNKKPVTNWQSQDEAFFEVAQEIRRVVEALRQKVIIAAASSDQAFAIHLSHDLATQGIVLWHQDAVSSQDRDAQDEAANQAIRTALAMLLIASTEAPYSSIIEQQLKVATLFGRPVIVVWAAGVQWSEVVPGGWKQEESIDARGERYERALSELLLRLRRLAFATSSVAVSSDTSKVLSPARNPYKGLRAFTSSDAGDFFGRESLIQDLIQTLQEALISEPQAGGSQRLLAVVGASGSGKSSVVMAGVLPRLQNGVLPGSAQWLYLEPMKPGAHPLEALAVALTRTQPVGRVLSFQKELESDSRRVLHLLASQIAPKPATKVVLLVDQFEELFTATVSEKERKRFIDLLVTAVTEPGGPLVVLLTLRADCYDGPMGYPDLYRLINAHHCAVLPMEIDDLRSVIEKPAALSDVQVTFESFLVDDLLFEAQGQVGALPLLEFTLDQLFELRTAQMLTRQAYRRVGGVKGALAKHAEFTYASLLTEEHRRLARILFLRLIDPGKTEQDTRRRRIFMTELAFSDPERTAIMEKVVDAFVTARLLTTNEVEGDTTIEVSHEALIREWIPLAAWLREAREDVILQQSISADAAEWARRGRLVDRLYRGTQLTEAQAWAERSDPNADEVVFLRAAAVERQYQEDAALSQKRRELDLQRRVVSRQRQFITALSIFSIVVVMVGSIAGVLYVQANLEAEISRSQALAANADLALTQHQIDLALLLSIKALQKHDTPEARNSLFNALMQSPHLAAILSNGYNYSQPYDPSHILALAFGKDEQTLYTYNGSHQILHWMVQKHTYQPITIPVNLKAETQSNLAFSPDNHTLGIVSNDGIWLVDLQANTARPSLAPPLAGISAAIPLSAAIAFNHDGGLVAASRCDSYPHFAPDQPLPPCAESKISIWNTQNGQEVRPSFTINMDTLGLAFSSDGTQLAVASPTTIIIVDIATGHKKTLPRMNTDIISIAFSPKDRKLAAGSQDGTIHIWNTLTGEPLSVFSGHKGPVESIVFSHNGDILASASQDGTIRLWQVSTATEMAGSPFIGHPDQVFSIAFSPNDAMLASGGENGSLMVWDMNAEGTINRRLADAGGTHNVLWSRDGTIIIGTDDGKLLLLDSNRGELQKTLTEMTAYPNTVQITRMCDHGSPHQGQNLVKVQIQF